MRPVNLIPPEDRRGDKAPLRSGPLSYVVIGALALVLVAVLLMVTTSNDIADKEEQVAQLEADLEAATAEAERLAPYAEFATLRDRARGDDREPRPEPLRLGARDARARPGDPGGRDAYEPERLRVRERGGKRVDDADRRPEPHDLGMRGLARVRRQVRRRA